MSKQKEEMLGLLSNGEVVWKKEDRFHVIDIQGIERIFSKTPASLDFEFSRRTFVFDVGDLMKNVSIIIESEDISLYDFVKIIEGEEPEILAKRKENIRAAFEGGTLGALSA